MSNRIYRVGDRVLHRPRPGLLMRLWCRLARRPWPEQEAVCVSVASLPPDPQLDAMLRAQWDRLGPTTPP